MPWPNAFALGYGFTNRIQKLRYMHLTMTELDVRFAFESSFEFLISIYSVTALFNLNMSTE